MGKIFIQDIDTPIKCKHFILLGKNLTILGQFIMLAPFFSPVVIEKLSFKIKKKTNYFNKLQFNSTQILNF